MSTQTQAEIERLGRQRPPQFKTMFAEVGFVLYGTGTSYQSLLANVDTDYVWSHSFSTCMAIMLSEYFVSGFAVIVPDLARELKIPISSSTWPASAYSLVLSSMLLPFGRLADIHGGRPVYILGILWLAIWSLIAGFSTDQYMLVICRAFQGLGPAAFMPSGMMLLGCNYRPGPRKNFIFSIYGACGAAGFFTGIFFAGLTAQYTTWAWYFWVGSILTFVTAAVAYMCIPRTSLQKPQDIRMDWTGSILFASSFLLIVFAITDSAYASRGFASPYIVITLVLGILLLGGTIYVEGWVASQPLVPFSLFAAPNMKPLFIALFFTYGSLGVFLLYATFYCSNVMGASSLQLVAWFVPLAIGGCIIGTFGGFILHLIPGTPLILFSGVCWIIAPLLFAIAPEGAKFWAWVFTSMTCATLGIDITFNVTNIFISTSLPSSQQGLAGALINSVMQLAIACCLGIAAIIAKATEGKGLRRSYQAVFWFEVACATLALALLLCFVKIDSASSILTQEERSSLELQNETEGGIHANQSTIREHSTIVDSGVQQQLQRQKQTRFFVIPDAIIA